MYWARSDDSVVQSDHDQPTLAFNFLEPAGAYELSAFSSCFCEKQFPFFRIKRLESACGHISLPGTLLKMIGVELKCCFLHDLANPLKQALRPGFYVEALRFESEGHFVVTGCGYGGCVYRDLFSNGFQ